MSNPISIRFTYDVTTPESCELGDFSDNGFCDEFGRVLTTREDDLQSVPDCAIELWETFGDLEYLIRRAIDLGISEPSDSRIHSHCWFSSVDPDTNYTTGEETRYSLHIRGLNDQQMQEIAEILDRGYIGEESEYWLEEIEQGININGFFQSIDRELLNHAKVITAIVGNPENNESILLALISNLSDKLTLNEWTRANELYGMHKQG